MNAAQLPPTLQGKLNISKYPEKLVHPALETILNEVSHFNPNFTYVANDTHFHQGQIKIAGVAVYERAQPVGMICIGDRYSREGKNETTYSVRAEGIERRRGNTHTTKNLKHAMKSIKETFKAKQLDARAADLLGTVTNKVDRMTRNANGHLEGIVRGAATELLSFLAAYDTLDPKPAQIPAMVSAKLGTTWKTYVDNARIAKSVHGDFAASNGACVRIEEDGTLSMLDLTSKGFFEHTSTYDLPSYYQEKITILKVMEENQPVDGIGAWFESYDTTNGVRRELKYFFLVGGETRTTC